MKIENEDAIKALETVIDIVNFDIALNDDTLSGDKDTRNLAFKATLEKHNISPSSVYHLPTEDVEKYFELYGDEINSNFKKLIELGKENEKLYNSFLSYLNDKLTYFKI